MTNLRVFLPQVSSYQLESIVGLSHYHEQLEIQPLRQDWETIFCEFIGISAEALPWTQLRLAQFDIGKNVKTVCCADPVLMQLTHRGAYMLGQAPLQFSQSESIRIVAQINERLMRDGEQLFFIDKYSWLYTNEKSIALTSMSLKNLIGKDIFDYPYQGHDAEFWQQISTEIQMLIKQMIDYQGLSEISPETILNVHFAEVIDPSRLEEIPFVKNESVGLVTDNELIQTFCTRSFLAQYTISQMNNVEKDNTVVFAFDSERDKYPAIIQHWLERSEEGDMASSILVCQDSVIRFKPKLGWLKRLFKFKS